MKKTNRMATIGQRNPSTGRVTYIDRRIWENENGAWFVRVNGSWFTLDEYENDRNCTVSVWF